MHEREGAKYPLCLPASVGGTLITVQVKLNMREISRAAGVCGGRRGGWGGNQEEAGPWKSL